MMAFPVSIPIAGVSDVTWNEKTFESPYGKSLEAEVESIEEVFSFLKQNSRYGLCWVSFKSSIDPKAGEWLFLEFGDW